MAILQSVNIGQPRPIPAKSAMTGIYKEPVGEDEQIEDGEARNLCAGLVHVSAEAGDMVE